MWTIHESTPSSVIDNDIRWVVKTIETISIPTGTCWFLFGSTLNGGTGAIDIDVLILYRTFTEVISIRKSLSAFLSTRPLHLLFLTYEEERELRFLCQERCVELFPTSEIRFR